MKYVFKGCTTNFTMNEQESADSLQELWNECREFLDGTGETFEAWMLGQEGLTQEDFYNEDGDYLEEKYEAVQIKYMFLSDEQILDLFSSCNSHCYYQGIWCDDKLIYSLGGYYE